ncbi:hypothetical protein KAFR_0I00570 [Kazachstania africana CBS 2517]|uniref:Acyl carrier protein n=1 Tax=Kazachstania africana (strain ATCC 22294 / BCRC 22015 / CBS 2517 / CECT 1963 / NBRC 1671 / NRRL Y-8276) TaxID=1071382 RepID=H2AZN8_KAZAF|nr:hypothetical protein KAFR_0I00570 [Kazachstania africana CBS 2517]CCF59838.1 hypothetical protein KAFR_0I00570 [Kazachstania africana CBS 2517]
MFRSLLRANVARSAMISQGPVRFYSPSNLSKTAISSRVIDVIKSFNKTDASSSNPTEITMESSFKKDLGLDSLDTVELIVAMEEEFSIEIPDKVADELTSVAQTVDYIKDHTDAS